jgi:Ca2+-transporting ATPase
VPLPLESLLPLLALASLVLWAEEARKAWVRAVRRARP